MGGALIGVTGATGGLGGRVAARLAGAGTPQRLLVRDPARAPQLDGAEVAAGDYADPDGLRRSLEGVTTLLLVSASERPDRVALHTGAVEAAVDAGVQRVVYTSFLGAAERATFLLARHHWHTERHLAASGLPVTSLRDGLYLDFLPGLAGPDGVIRGPAGEGRLAPVSRDDVADAATAVLLAGLAADEAGGRSTHDGATYDLTGPEALTLDEVAAALSAASGRTVRYQRETLEEAFASRASYGAPEWMVEGWVSTYTAIAAGELDVVSGDVERLAGHPPSGVPEWLAAHPESVAHLRPTP